MPRFVVEITEGNHKAVEVEAEDWKKAKEQVENDYESGKILLDDAYSGWVDFEVHAVPLIITPACSLDHDHNARPEDCLKHD